MMNRPTNLTISAAFSAIVSFLGVAAGIALLVFFGDVTGFLLMVPVLVVAGLFAVNWVGIVKGTGWSRTLNLAVTGVACLCCLLFGGMRLFSPATTGSGLMLILLGILLVVLLGSLATSRRP